MDYKCNHCEKKSNDLNKIFRHLKNEHRIKENDERIQCVVDFDEANHCERSYLTFNALRTHVRKCVKLKQEQEENKVNEMIINKYTLDR